MGLASFFKGFWNSSTSATRTTFSPIFRLRLRRSSNRQRDSLFLLGREDLRNLQALLSESKALPLFRRLLEGQAELETNALLRAETTEQLQYQRGRIAALLFIADLPQRVADTLTEYYKRDDAKRADATRAPDLTGHWGSPNSVSFWDRSPADRRDAPGSGTASVEPSGSHPTF